MDASFVISPFGNNNVNISARSLGLINVQLVMEKLGGGGNRSAAAVQFEHTTPAQAEERIRAAIDDYLG